MISYRLCGLCVSLDRQSNGFLGNIGKHRLCIVRGQSSLPYSGLLLNLNVLSFLMRFKAIALFVIDNRSGLKKNMYNICISKPKFRSDIYKIICPNFSTKIFQNITSNFQYQVISALWCDSK